MAEPFACLSLSSTTCELLKLNEMRVAKGWQLGEKTLAGKKCPY
jgi:hypothetical protein